MKLKLRLTAIVFISLFFCLSSFSQGRNRHAIRHARGFNQIGLRAGIGTENKIAYGLSYNYHFNTNTSLSVELDREEAVFGYTDFTNQILIAPGVDYAFWQPSNFLYFHAGISACVGMDSWKSQLVSESTDILIYGVNVGLNSEVYIGSYLSAVIKAQQYFLTGDGYSYLKPNFSLSLRYNF